MLDYHTRAKHICLEELGHDATPTIDDERVANGHQHCSCNRSLSFQERPSSSIDLTQPFERATKSVDASHSYICLTSQVKPF